MEKALEYQLFFGIDSIVGGCGVRRRLRIWNVFDLAPPLLLALAGAFFCVGLLAGFLLSAHLDGAVSVEQVGLLPAAVTRLRPHVLRDSEDAGLCQTDFLLGAHPTQEGIKPLGAAPGGETQDSIRLLFQQGLDFPGDLPVQVCGCCNHCFPSIT